mgnify:CR=1 FL=1
MTNMCPKFESKVHEVISKHSATHYMEGGNGVSCYVWVVGPGVTSRGNSSSRKVRSCFPSNSLDLTGTFGADLKSVPGYVDHKINLD